MGTVHAEWTKIRTLRSTWWLIAGSVAAVVAASTATLVGADTGNCPTPAECFEDTVALSLTGIRLGQVPVAVLGVLVLGAEYGTGTITATLGASANRLRVLAAKALVLAGLVAPSAAAAVAASLAAGRLILPGNGFDAAAGYPPISLGDGPTLRAAGGSVAYLVLVALLALGAAALIRDTAVAVTAVLGLLLIAPAVGVLVTDPDWSRWLERLAPMTAGLAVQATVGLDRLPIGPWPGLGVLAAYTALFLTAGALTFARRPA